MASLEDPNIEGFKVLQAILKTFWDSDRKRWYNGNRSTGAIGDGYAVWPVSIVIQAVVDAARVNPGWHQTARELLDSFGNYFNPKVGAYSATEGKNEDIYYDDDAQVASAMITGYEVLGDKTILDRAVPLVNFLMTGYEPKDKGVRWHYERPGSNTCTTAEVGVACARLARYVTEPKPYIDFAIKCHDFLWTYMRDKNDGLMCDGFDGDGVNPRKWTYNQGTPITLSTLIWAHTHDEKYYHAAHDLAKAATDTNEVLFDRDTPDHSKRYYRDELKFYQLLVEGFADYLLFFGKRDPELSEHIFEVVNRHLFFIWRFVRNPGHESWYCGRLQIFELDQERADAFVKITGETGKPYQPTKEDHVDGDPSKPLAPELMSMGSAARVFFQSARVVPLPNY